MEKIVASSTLKLISKVEWGRKEKAEWTNNAGALALISLCPLLVVFNWITLEKYDGSVWYAFQAAASSDNLTRFFLDNFPRPSTSASLGYLAWLLFQAFLYSWLPGQKCQGQLTPGGHLLSYTTNGVAAWAFTHLVYLALSMLNLVDGAGVARNWEGLLVAVNTYGFLLAVFSQVKGYWFPSYPEDCKTSGSLLFDFWAGVELNPRVGKNWDLKFFHNGRPGIVAWTLIDISFAVYQYQTFGRVSAPMVVATILHAFYVVDFFHNESWYTRTIDINHDHFGFMLAWGDTTWLPTFYTLQSQFLARYPSSLSDLQTLGVLVIGLLGYAMFRSSNYQKDHVRAKAGDAIIWGRPAQVIRCTYLTHGGKEHKSLLLKSGWWGMARHANYLADLIMTWAMCATCGFTHILPWSYFIYMCILLNHRIIRDEGRCSQKYGEKWKEYCEAVPYRLIPGIY